MILLQKEINPNFHVASILDVVLYPTEVVKQQIYCKIRFSDNEVIFSETPIHLNINFPKIS